MNSSENLGVILIVEDEALIRESIALTFRESGCAVLEASSAETAILLLQSGQQIDVLFTDIQLSGVLSGEAHEQSSHHVRKG